MSNVPLSAPSVHPDPGQVLWMGGESYRVSRLPDLLLFKSPVKLEKLTGEPATYHAAVSPIGPVCSCGDGPYCEHVPTLQAMGYLPPAADLRAEVEALFFGREGR